MLIAVTDQIVTVEEDPVKKVVKGNVKVSSYIIVIRIRKIR